MDEPNPTRETTTPKAWPWMVVGGLCFALGPLLLWGQMTLHRMGMPWYIPGLATVGVIALWVAGVRRPSILLRIVSLSALLLCALEWYGLAVGTRTPQYTGPIAVAKPIPRFATKLVTGESFSHRDLAHGHPSLLVFFRGRW